VPLPDPPAINTPEAKKLLDRIREIEAKLPDPQRAPTMRDGAGINERVFVRGNHKTPGVEAPRARGMFGKPAFTEPGSGRLELAKTITDPSNPLVARVIVNRLWKHHFAKASSAARTTSASKASRRRTRTIGLVGKRTGEPDRKGGGAWSLKRMHRMMLLSTAYQQASKATPDQTAKAVTADAENKLLHRRT